MSGYDQATGGRAAVTVAWRGLMLRLFVLVLPAQVAGALVGSLPIVALGSRIVDHPWASAGPVIGLGVGAGLAVGLWARPPEGRSGAALALAAAYGVAGFAVLILFVWLRAPSGSALPALSWVLGGAVALACQTVITWLLWRRRVPNRP